MDPYSARKWSNLQLLERSQPQVRLFPLAGHSNQHTSRIMGRIGNTEVQILLMKEVRHNLVQEQSVISFIYQHHHPMNFWLKF